MSDWETDRCELIAQYGYWNQHPELTLAMWRTEVLQGCTLNGYWDWVLTQINEEEQE